MVPIPRNSQTYSIFVKKLQLAAVVIAVSVMFFGIVKAHAEYSHVDLCDTTSMVDLLQKEIDRDREESRKAQGGIQFEDLVWDAPDDEPEGGGGGSTDTCGRDFTPDRDP
jgi:hypothetical protein